MPPIALEAHPKVRVFLRPHNAENPPIIFFETRDERYARDTFVKILQMKDLQGGALAAVLETTSGSRLEHHFDALAGDQLNLLGRIQEISSMGNWIWSVAPENTRVDIDTVASNEPSDLKEVS